jgi:hypothetical protein
MAKNDAGFERDFGYLMPFLDKLSETAKTLADPAARERLSRLMAEEKERWAEIRALVSGKPAVGGAQRSGGRPGSGGTAESSAKPGTVPPRRAASPEPSSTAGRLTVGSLRRGS